MAAKGLELRIGKDIFVHSENVYRLNKPVSGFTYIKLSFHKDSASLGFITEEKGFVDYGAEGNIVFFNGSIVRIVFED